MNSPPGSCPHPTNWPPHVSFVAGVQNRPDGDSGPPQAVAQARTSPSGRVLLVEPHHAAVSDLRRCLERRGYLVARSTDVRLAARRLVPEAIEVAIVDGRFGQAAVLQSCAVLTRHSGLIVLVGKGAWEFGVAALEAGADDCLTAPHNPREVVARVGALLRCRRRPVRLAERRVGDTLVLHPGGRIASADGRSLVITPIQCRLLEVLCSRPGEVIPRAELLELVYGDACECFERAIDVHVSRLRRRLAELGASDLISCYRGVGYRFEV